MAVRVLVVDDSSFFRRQIQKLLAEDKELEVVGTANNGKEAIEQTLKLKPDVITMDIEMPVMDGIAATKEIMRQQPTPVLMFSSLTTDGAKATLEALDAGALDFIPKRFEDISRNLAEVQKALCDKVREIGKNRKLASPSIPSVKKPVVSPVVNTSTFTSQNKGKIKLVAIGTSTGGPVALQEVLTHLPSNLSVPIIMVQHMPGTFTGPFAARLNQICGITVKEAEDGELLQAGTAYLAPGGKQLLVKKQGQDTIVNIQDGDINLTYKPCVDVTFDSIAKSFSNDVLAIVLTGMGADGCEGAKQLKARGAQILAQDKDSCVIYGMPAAIVEANLADHILPLNSISAHIIEQL